MTSGPPIRDTKLHRRWDTLKPPLRPNAEIVAAVAAAIEGHGESVLLLGVTPEFAALGQTLIAVDLNQTMIDTIWPGDNETRRALRGDWSAMPVPAGHFSAVIGDGSLGVFDYPSGYARFFRGLARVMRPGARVAVRVYAAPRPGEAFADLRDAALAGQGGGFSAFKWRLAMARAATAADPNVPVNLIREDFDRAFPDRAALARATGWSREEIASIDDYAASDASISYPTNEELIAVLPADFAAPRFVSTGNYELAERCPLLVADYRP